MNVLSRDEFIKMIWGLSSHDREMEKWNIEYVSNGGQVCFKSEQKLASKIGMLFNEINRELQKDNRIRTINIGDVLINQEIPDILKNTKIESLLLKASVLLNDLSNPRNT